MVLGVTGLLLLAAFITCIVAAMGKCPLWVSSLLVIVLLMLQMWGR